MKKILWPKLGAKAPIAGITPLLQKHCIVFKAEYYQKNIDSILPYSKFMYNMGLQLYIFFLTDPV